jgi:hypothetical protein
LYKKAIFIRIFGRNYFKTQNIFQVSWWEPARANGLLQGYRIYLLHQNFTSVQTIRDNKSAMVETLTRLSKSPFSAGWIVWREILKFHIEVLAGNFEISN